MKYIQEFRNPSMVHALVKNIEKQVDQKYNFMEFCGGHTHTIFRYALHRLLPNNIEFIHGPGCPVCVLPISKIDAAIEFAQKDRVILCTYGDLLRVPGSQGKTLLKAKATGLDVRMVYSPLDAIVLAQKNRKNHVIFFAIGFETTSPATAVALQRAIEAKLQNFSVFCNHVTTPAALESILEFPIHQPEENVPIHGFIGPAHVSTVIGSQPYEYFASHYKKPIVIAGFEPLDIVQGVWMLIRQVKTKRAMVENQYTRAVTPFGNEKAQGFVNKFFQLRKFFEWRGLGVLPNSALQIKPEYEFYDAEKRFPIDEQATKENKECLCPSVIRGIKKPTDCKLFSKICTPENPIGSCMVSSEGTCAAYYLYAE
jgi:hydrogenase expression/formation protein HypD